MTKKTLLLCAALLLAGCDKVGQKAEPLTVLGGSELKDLEPILQEVAQKSGVELKIDYTGTLDGVQRLQSGETPDLVWFSHAKYLQLQGGLGAKILSSEKIMLSPVVMGVKRSAAQKWGWDKKAVTWRDIAAKASSGELKYAMTNPAASNSGLNALIGVVSALSGKGDAITADDVRAPALKAFFRGQALTAGSSGWLAEAYVRDQDKLSGMINYESVLLSLNSGGQLREPLTLIYPQDGVITADYPLMLLNEEQRASYDKLVETLRSPEIQQKIMTQTLRRPVNTSVALADAFPRQLMVELPFPATAKAIDAVLGAYLNDTRKPANTIFVLDISGSMAGDRLEQLKTALLGLSGADQSLTGRFAAFAPRERVTLIPFSTQVNTPQTIQLSSATLQQDRQKITTLAQKLEVEGSTNIYAALQEAYQLARQSPPDRFTSIVLMTDGARTTGPNLNDFEQFYRQLPAQAQNVKTFTVLFGDSDEEEMRQVAQLTGGRTFDGTKNLQAAFKEIRGYQ